MNSVLPGLALLLLAAVLGFFLVKAVISAWQRAQELIRQYTRFGAVPPKPTLAAWARGRRISKFFLWWQVGKIKIVELEPLRLDGPCILGANHSHYVDPAVLYLLGDRPPRFMAGRETLEVAGGLGALVFGPLGAFPVDVGRGKGGSAMKVAIRVLLEGEILTMFPHSVRLSGKPQPFKKGIAAIMKAAAAQSGQPTHFQPVHISYGSYPGEWIHKLPQFAQYLFLFLAAPFYRCGATVIIGRRISSQELPANTGEATALIEKRVRDLAHYEHSCDQTAIRQPQ